MTLRTLTRPMAAAHTPSHFTARPGGILPLDYNTNLPGRTSLPKVLLASLAATASAGTAGCWPASKLS